MDGNGLLRDKVTLVFGAGGAVGRAVSETFLGHGARAYLSGRTIDSVRAAVPASLSDRAQCAEVDATDESAVAAYVDQVQREAGRIDVVFNAISSAHPPIVRPATDVDLDAFMDYMSTMARSQFLTARVAARHMIPNRSGVVVLMGATPARGIAPLLAGPSAGHAAVEGLARCLATEWGPLGLRVVAVRSGGMQETRNIQGVLTQFAALQGTTTAEMMRATNDRALMRRTPSLAETANVVAFLASDLASSVTGAIINASCGEVVD